VKLKCRPEDFQVEELPTVTPGREGPYTWYRLSKRGLGTLEALEAVRHRWDVPAAAIGTGGLKDKHAATVQYLTIRNGPWKTLQQSSLTLEPVGRLTRPYSPQGFRGNRFTIVLRDLAPRDVEDLGRALRTLPRDGVPNYFDDQRFGSVTAGGEFIAAAWVRGDHERAFRLATAEPNPHDRPGIRDEKRILSEYWGRWDQAKAQLPRGHLRSLVTYLVDHPTDFRGAFARMRRELRSLYFSAWQSHLWNKMLSRRIESLTRPDQRSLIQFQLGPMPIHHDLDENQASELRSHPLPLPASRTSLPENFRELATSVLAEEGLVWEELRVRHLKDVFFSKGTRPALIEPLGLVHESGPDDLYKGKTKLTVSFELARGAYATLIVKALTRSHHAPQA
jgi:tRNA pseudouridine13 synthase